MALDDVEAIGKEEPADEGQLTGIVIPHDGDAPRPVIHKRGVHLHGVGAVDALGHLGVAQDLALAERRPVGRSHALYVPPDIRHSGVLISSHGRALTRVREQMVFVGGADRRAVLAVAGQKGVAGLLVGGAAGAFAAGAFVAEP